MPEPADEVLPQSRRREKVAGCAGSGDNQDHAPVRAVVIIEVPLMGEWRCGGKWQGSGLIALRADPYFAVRARPRQ